MPEVSPEQLYAMKYEIESLKNKIVENNTKLTKLDEILHNPDNGVYRRIAKASESIEEQQKMLKALERKVSNKFTSFDKTLSTFELDLQSLNTTDKALKDISGENLSHLRYVVEKGKKTDKILWAIGTATVTATVKMIYDAVISILQSS